MVGWRLVQIGSGRYEWGGKYGWGWEYSIVFEMGGAGTKWSLGLDTKANIPFANYDYFYHSCHSFTIFWDIINFQFCISTAFKQAIKQNVHTQQI